MIGTSILILSLILSIYSLGNYILYTLPLVEAGPISGIKKTGLQRISKKINSAYKKRIGSDIIRYRRFIIQGNCMSQVNLTPGSVISVKLFNSEKEKKLLKNGDVALIFLNDDKFHGYKLRAIDKIYENDAETFYYNSEGHKTQSSQRHKLINILGVVDFDECIINC